MRATPKVVLLCALVVLVVAGISIAVASTNNKNFTFEECNSPNRTPEFIQDCFDKLPQNSANVPPCGTIKEETNRDYCYMAFAGALQNADMCLNVTATSAPSCYGRIFAHTQNLKLCNSITEKTHKDACYIALARFFKNSAYCEKLAKKDRPACMSMIDDGV
ncbi:MAG: hypothetical protein K0S38_221 [Candidatus Paceibacter sp.]|jgi:hypothetical protein|nr:hypothetical protein [Candidatus Paceibacter sp.]